MLYEPGSVWVFTATAGSVLSHWNGQRCRIIGAVTDEDSDGPMHTVRFSDGTVTDVFEDELAH